MSSTNLLYHFTNRKSFFDILEHLELESSLVDGLNDLNEANLQSCCSLPMFTDIEARKLVHKCSVLCFSKDYDNDPLHHSGANRPNMWAYYAGATDGACLVIDEEKFKEKNKILLDNYALGFDDVEYQYINSQKIDCRNEKNAESFIRANVKYLFFTKHISWQQEAERRVALLGLDPNKEKFNIDGCVCQIVLGKRFLEQKENIHKIIKALSNPNLKCYHKFVPHNFSIATDNTTGYWITECASQFFDPLIEQHKLTKREQSYYRWLREEKGYENILI